MSPRALVILPLVFSYWFPQVVFSSKLLALLPCLLDVHNCTLIRPLEELLH